MIFLKETNMGKWNLFFYDMHYHDVKGWINDTAHMTYVCK